MMKTTRRALCLLLLLTLLCPWAQAAPARDLRQVDETGERLEAVIGLFGAASLLRGVDSLPPDESPSGPFAEGVLLLGLARGLLSRTDENPADDTETLSVSAAEDLLAGLFSAPVALPPAPSCPCITRSGDSLTVRYDDVEAETSGGARIFSVFREGDRLNVLADVYASLASWQTDPAEVEPDCLTWEYTAWFTLEDSAASPFGFRLVSMQAFPEWTAGSLNTWQQVEEDGFSALLPPQLREWDRSRSANGRNAEYRYGSEDGIFTLTITKAAGASAGALSVFRTEALSAHPDAQILMEPRLHYASAEYAGEYTVMFAPDNGDAVYTIRLAFPAELQYEYSFYGEIIRNSFWFAGEPMG